ncbi:MAG: RluA family pseudouridine synthase [Parcubacteria group bacterium]|nr:RluA family pseudouridine synthase [Parcubacteria group bacterium]
MTSQLKLKPDFNIPLIIVYEDNDVVVLNKQAGISVHPSINEPSRTIANALIARYPEIKNVGDPSTSSLLGPEGPSGPRTAGQENLRPGIVHRLDKDTSGLLVIAKNQKAFEFLKKEWHPPDRMTSVVRAGEGKVIKKYFALVCGHLKNEKGEIVSELARSVKDFRKRMVVRPEKNLEKTVSGKLSVTEYKVIKKYRNYSLVEVIPKTGRTHQIRVHMASLGTPVAGDKIYGKNKEIPQGLTHQFLHAHYLSFGLPSGKKLALEADLPDDLEQVLAKLEK